MPVPKVTEAEFMDIFKATGGSSAEVARILNMNERNVHARRRRIEERRGMPMLSQSPHSPDYMAANTGMDEFPDWQQMEIKNGLLFVFSDAHLVPNEKSTAHRALLKMIQEFKPVGIIDNGDLLDFASISKHHRIGWDRQFSVKKELEWAGDCLDEIKKTAKGAKTKRTMGNHDQRFSGHISNNLGAYEGIRGFSLQEHLPGWPVSWAIRVNDNQLEVKHRWKGGIHATHNNTAQAGISYATGHLHSQKVTPFTDLRGDRWGVDVGTLASIYGPHFRYMEANPRNWRSGFAIFRFVNYTLRQPELLRVIDEQKGIVEYLGKDYSV